MTNSSKPVKRETFTSARYRGKSRPIILEVCSTYVKVGLKGCREAYTVTVDQLWTLGAKNAAESLRRERIAAAKKESA